MDKDFLKSPGSCVRNTGSGAQCRESWNAASAQVASSGSCKSRVSLKDATLNPEIKDWWEITLARQTDAVKPEENVQEEKHIGLRSPLLGYNSGGLATVPQQLLTGNCSPVEPQGPAQHWLLWGFLAHPEAGCPGPHPVWLFPELSEGGISQGLAGLESHPPVENPHPHWFPGWGRFLLPAPPIRGPLGYLAAPSHLTLCPGSHSPSGGQSRGRPHAGRREGGRECQAPLWC
ncbi:uncharacterized protein LOC110345603 [Heterocephalus glaber]|uniref:Uncharacterized protein LOC110345603 n=1 Tax=Heterocephalus glaber TaxID=10181 RepID=A0AAX6RSZ6_HETGA|nr:uncharacterized protein LOC110345603 [Heterocephalus glaber]